MGAEGPRSDDSQTTRGPYLRRAALRRVAMLLGVLFLVGPLIAFAALLVMYVSSVLKRRHGQEQRRRSVAAGLAEAVDLFAVALAGGHNLYAATAQVARWAGDPFGPAFASCLRRAAEGHSLADSLETLPTQLGPDVRPLIAALVAHDRHGAPILQNLAILAAESRRARRHDAEVMARRLPVVLLGPLVVCILPAFLLLTVVPLVAQSLGSILDSFAV